MRMNYRIYLSSEDFEAAPTFEMLLLREAKRARDTMDELLSAETAGREEIDQHIEELYALEAMTAADVRSRTERHNVFAQERYEEDIAHVQHLLAEAMVWKSPTHAHDAFKRELVRALRDHWAELCTQPPPGTLTHEQWYRWKTSTARAALRFAEQRMKVALGAEEGAAQDVPENPAAWLEQVVTA